MAALYIFVLAAVPFIQAAEKLEAHTVDKDEISVSGISAGGAMAAQFQTAYSASIKGMGSIAGVPYSCSGGQLGTALSSCMSSPSGINVNTMVSHARSRASAGQIDSLDNLKNSRLFIWAGTADTVVRTDVSKKMESFYADLATSSNVKALYQNGAEHTFPTENYGNPCSTKASPYLGKCSYNGAFELLDFIHGNLQRPSGSVALKGQLIEYDQTEFLNSSKRKRLFMDMFNPLKAYENMGKMMGSMLTVEVASASSIWDWWKKFLPGGGSLPGLPGSGGSLPGTGGSLPSLPGMGAGGSHSMDITGYAYIPSGCFDSTVVCKLHVAFHGCKMGRETIGDVFARHAGYNEVGELNNIIILYPQIKADTIANPNGCWDWWAYTGSNYDTKNGVQMKAIKAMIDRVTGDNV